MRGDVEGNLTVLNSFQFLFIVVFLSAISLPTPEVMLLNVIYPACLFHSLSRHIQVSYSLALIKNSGMICLCNSCGGTSQSN